MFPKKFPGQLSQQNVITPSNLKLIISDSQVYNWSVSAMCEMLLQLNHIEIQSHNWFVTQYSKQQYAYYAVIKKSGRQIFGQAPRIHSTRQQQADISYILKVVWWLICVILHMDMDLK